MPKESIEAHFDQRACQYENSPSWVHDGASLGAAVAAVAWTAPRTVLDLGAGTGALGAALACVLDPAPTLINLDTSGRMLAHTRAGACVVGDAHCLPFANVNFDLVMTRQAFHYFTRPAEVLTEIGRVLVGGGRLLVSQIVPFDDLQDTQFWRGAVSIRQPLRLRSWTAPQLRTAISSAGFVLETENQVVTRGSLNSWLCRYYIEDERSARLRELFEKWIRADRGVRAFERDGEDVTYAMRWVTLVARFGNS